MGRSIAIFDTIRSLAFGGISGAYASVGSTTARRLRGVRFTNDTDGDMMFSDDGSNDKIYVKAQSFVLWDVQSNVGPKDDSYVIPIGTQWSVKEVTTPTTGSVYIEGLS